MSWYLRDVLVQEMHQSSTRLIFKVGWADSIGANFSAGEEDALAVGLDDAVITATRCFAHNVNLSPIDVD